MTWGGHKPLLVAFAHRQPSVASRRSSVATSVAKEEGAEEGPRQGHMPTALFCPGCHSEANRTTAHQTFDTEWLSDLRRRIRAVIRIPMRSIERTMSTQLTEHLPFGWCP